MSVTTTDGPAGLSGQSARVVWREPLAWVASAVGLGLSAATAAWLIDAVPVVAMLSVAAALALSVAAWFEASRRATDRAAIQLRRFAEATDDPLLMVSRMGVTTFTNAAFRRLVGAEASEGVGIARLQDLVQDGERWQEALAATAERAFAGEAGELEVPIQPAGSGSGGIICLRLVAQPLPDGGVAWRGEDVGERRRAEVRLKRQLNLLADFLDNLPVGFFSVDAEGRFLYINRTLADWLGESAQSLCRGTQRFADFVAAEAPREGPAIGDLFGAFQRGDDGEVTLRPRTGAPFRAYLAQSQLAEEDGAFVHSRSLVLRDQWPLKDAAGGPSAAQRVRWLFDQAPVGVAMVDLGGQVSDCNRAFLKLIGLHRDGVVGRPLTDRISLEDRGDVTGQLSKVLMGTMRAAHLEVRMPGVNRDLVASLYASRMEEADGDVAGLVVHFIDTTEQKHLEAQFAHSQKMQAVGQLAGGVAHDFNNLLTAMIGFSDLLLERHGPEDPSFADIMQIKQNANRATNLVRQLLAFSRKQTLKPVFLDITEALSDMTSLLRRLLGENLELVMEHGADLGVVRVDPGQMDQVIVNLAVNARDAMPGGGTLTLRTSRLTLSESAERGPELIPAGDYVVIEVIDTGVGIRKKDMGLIFEPFFSTKEVGAGTGLGLSTVYGIIKQTDGYIVVDSAPGEGTTFCIYLPRYEPAVAPVTEGELATGRSSARIANSDEATADLTGVGTVLLVEDEDAVRMFGARALRARGYRVLEAPNGEAALDVINDGEAVIDIIVSDVVMPGMDGHTLVRLVRQELPTVRVILMSGYAEDVVSADLWADPTIHFLPKPFTLQGLAAKVKGVLESPLDSSAP